MKMLLAIFLLCISAPAMAQEAAKPPADMKERVALAKQFHQVRPLRPEINMTIDSFGKDLPEAEQKKYWDDMRRVFDYKTVEESSIQSMAETFTVPELKAMVEYYSKPEAQSAASKMGEYEVKLTPVVAKAIDAALLDIKYPKKP